MKQPETHKPLIDILKKYGPLPTGKISKFMGEISNHHMTGYNFRWGQQQLKEKGIIDIDKSVRPNIWYLK